MSIGKLKEIIFYVIIIVIIIAGAMVIKKISSLSLGAQLNIQDTTNVLTLIEREPILRTARYNFEKIVEIDFGGRGNIGGEWLLYVAVGHVDAGIRFDGIKSESVQVNGKEVTIEMPSAYLIDCALNAPASYIYEENYGPLNFITDVFNDEPDLLELAEANAIVSFRESALEGGILEQAQFDAEHHLRAILLAAGFETVEFTRDTAVPAHDPSCMLDAAPE